MCKSEDTTASGGRLFQMPTALWRKYVLRQSVWAKGTLSILECWCQDVCVEDTLGVIYGKCCIPLTIPKNIHGERL